MHLLDDKDTIAAQLGIWHRLANGNRKTQLHLVRPELDEYIQDA